MLKSGAKNHGLPITALMLTIVITGVLFAGSGCDSTPPLEISLSQTTVPEQTTRIYIGGAVNNPGFYTLKPGDTLESLIQAAGGATDGADLSQIELYIPGAGETATGQKVDINRAGVWLLDALPGIGEARAQAIVAYRDKNGPFNNVNELLKVEGIGEDTLAEIREYITVSD